jgi:hypothetical protein
MIHYVIGDVKIPLKYSWADVPVLLCGNGSAEATNTNRAFDTNIDLESKYDDNAFIM